MNKVVIAVIVIILLGAGVYFYMQNKNSSMVNEEKEDVTETMETVIPNSMEQTITLAEQNESSESGTAVLTEADGKVTVTLNMTGAPSGVAQPAHIHVGSCPNVGAVEYPLTNVVDGKSVTVLDVTLADLAAKQPLGINVHKSAAEAKVYVSCGNLTLPGGSSAASPATAAGTMKY